MEAALTVARPRQLTSRRSTVQIGTRNAQNFSLLRAVGRSEFPVLYKVSP
jgi:3-deoxy-D-arabino-heptulosonate 7-phosphate (DAHP) synthase